MEFIQHILDWDTDLFLFLNGFHNDYWDTIILMMTRKETWVPFYVIILWYFFKNYRSKAIFICIALAVLVVACDQLAGVMKITVQRFRPVHNPAIEHLVHNVLRKGGLYGFVSAHAANSFGVMVFTSRIFKQRSYTVLLIIWALILSYSRIYSGVHYPLDLLGGALLGWGLGSLLFKLLMFVENHFFFARSPKIERTLLQAEQSGTVWLVFGVLMATVFIMAHLLHHYNFL